MSSFTPTMYTNSVYDVFLGYEEYPTPEVNTKWIVIVHSRTGKSCQWYTTAQLPLLTGYYMHEKLSISIPTDSHVRCEYNVNKAPIGALDETELGLMDALFEVTEPQKSRKSIVTWLWRCVDDGLFEDAIVKRVMAELEVLN